MSDVGGGISHIFFEVPGVLVDRAVLRTAYRAHLGQIMAERYGRDCAIWSAAYDRVLSDWDSYYADLNLSGDDGIADMWEGLFRTTRALFRLTGTPMQEKAELTALSRELPGLASRGVALCPNVPETLRQLDEAGLVLGVISYSLGGVVEALIDPVKQHFKGAINSPERAEHFEKDLERYRGAAASAQVEPERCLVVDDQPRALKHAQQAGMHVFHISGAGRLHQLTDLALRPTSESAGARNSPR